MNKTFTLIIALLFIANMADAQFLIKKTDTGSLVPVEGELRFSQKQETGAWAVGDTYKSGLDVSGISEIYKGSTVFGLTYTVDDLLMSVNLEPQDKNLVYFPQTVTKDQFAGWGYDVDYAYDMILADYVARYGVEVAYDMFCKTQGDYAFDIDLPYYDSFYILVAGISPDMQKTTAVECYEIVTPDITPSANTFQIQLENVGPTSASVVVVPDDDLDPYTIVMLENDDIADWTDDDILDWLESNYRTYIESNLYYGPIQMDYSDGMLPETDYTVCVFGYNKGITTKLFRKDFQTEKAGDPSGITFEITPEVIDCYTALLHVKPSDETVLYFATMIREEQYEQYKDDLTQFMYDIAEGGFITINQYLDMFQSVGSVTKEYYELYPNTKYYSFAVAFEKNGDDIKFYEPVVCDEVVTTPAEDSRAAGRKSSDIRAEDRNRPVSVDKTPEPEIRLLRPVAK